MKHICIVAEGYPTADNPIFSFVDKLVCEFAEKGYPCSVVAPQSITKILFRGVKKRKAHWTKLTKNNNVINVYQPLYISFSNSKKLRFFSHMMMQMAVKKGVRKVNRKNKIDIMYAHFWHMGVYAGKEAVKLSLPLFVACGEDKVSVRARFDGKRIEKSLTPLKGVISVSTENKRASIELGLAKEENIIVLPNGADANIFYPRDRKNAREELGLREDDFVVGFVGSFDERKGPHRLSEAIKNTGIDIKSIFIGSGPKQPDCDGIVFSGRLSHEKIPEYLSACDVFVLPTLSEGCCNAIVEAMACGLPVISANLPFNDDILDETNSIQINPHNVDEIADAILKIKNDNALREKLREGAVRSGQNLSVEKRAEKALAFMNELTK